MENHFCLCLTTLHSHLMLIGLKNHLCLWCYVYVDSKFTTWREVYSGKYSCRCASWATWTKKTMNSYLTPLVQELKRLWTGVVMKSASGGSVFVRAALICTACDIPASRKVSGFVSHSAYRGCSRCLKPFPTETFGEKADYSGFDRSTWEPHSNSSHRYYANKHKDSVLGRQRKEIERIRGCRCSFRTSLLRYCLYVCDRSYAQHLIGNCSPCYFSLEDVRTFRPQKNPRESRCLCSTKWRWSDSDEDWIWFFPIHSWSVA